MITMIRNITSFGSCETCDDSGVVAVDLELVFDGRSYDRWAGICDRCEEGERRRVSWARRRCSWRYDERGAA